MALTFHDGFEGGNIVSGQWTDLGGTAPTLATAIKNTGAYSLRCNAAAALSGVLVATYSQQMSFYLYIATLPDALCIIAGMNDADDFVELTTAGYITLYDSAGALKGTSTTQLATGRWYRICYAGDGGAAAKVYIDGILEITAASGMAGVIGRDVGVETSCTADLYFDDVVCGNATAQADLGNIVVLASCPKGAGDVTEFTPSAGSNWDCVNEVPYSDVDYVSHAAAASDLYAIQTCADIGLVGTVQAVRTIARGKRTGVSTTTNQVKDNGTIYQTAWAMGTSYGWSRRYDAVMPNGGAAWTNARFDAFQIGHDCTAGTSTVSFDFIEVAYIPTVVGGVDVAAIPLGIWRGV